MGLFINEQVHLVHYPDGSGDVVRVTRSNGQCNLSSMINWFRILLTFPFVIEIRFGWPLRIDLDCTAPPWSLLSFLCLHFRCSSRTPEDRLRWRIRRGIRNFRGPQRVSGLRGSLQLGLRLRFQPHLPCQAQTEAGREEALQPGGDQQEALAASRHENTRKFHFPTDRVSHSGGASLKVSGFNDLFRISFINPLDASLNFCYFPLRTLW